MKLCIAASFLFNLAFVPFGAALADAINDQQDTDEEGLP